MLEITYQKVTDLIPYVNNSRTHSEAQVSQVAASIKEFGFTNPILIDSENVIIAGHGRLLAAQKLGLAEVPCIALDHLSESQRKAYVIADNKLALNAGWEVDLLKIELNNLDDLDFDLSILGFDEIELAKMFDSDEPELKEQEYTEVFNVIVECEDEGQQEKIFNRLDSEGYKCRVQSL
jgi:ParB-like chromosome segregation protein Spo0J